MSITAEDVRALWAGTTHGTTPLSAAENERILQILNQHRTDRVRDAQRDLRSDQGRRHV